MDDVYELLKSRKREYESFSDVIRRTLTRTKPKITDVMGLGRNLPAKEKKEIRKTVQRVKKDWNKALEKKVKR